MLLQELCLYLDEERTGTVTVCTDCGGPCPPPHPAIQAVRDEGDGSSSSTNNDETETSASNLLEELNAINAREKLYLKGNKMGLNGEQKLCGLELSRMLECLHLQMRSWPISVTWRTE